MITERNIDPIHIPIKLTKGVDKNGKATMKMNGVLSTTSKDDDGQHLNPAGFDMSDFMSQGFMNWHHQSNKNPMAIIGRPTGHTLDKGKNEMNIDFELFPENPMAQQAYQLQEVLEANGLTLGLSLEGKATEFRDETSSEYVEKARITGCALTPAPKNKDAIVEIIKGNVEEYELIKGDIISEGSGSEIGEGKNPLALESLEGSPKNVVKKGEDEEEDEDEKKEKMLTKSEVIERIGEKFPGSTYETLEKFYIFTLNLEKGNKTSIMKTKEGIKEDTLQKALVDLGLTEEAKELEKANEEVVLTSEERFERLEKGLEGIAIMLKGKKEEELKKGEEGKEMKKKDDEEEEEEEGKEKEMKKASSEPDLIKGMIDKLGTTLGEKMDSFNKTVEEINETVTGLKKGNEDMSEELVKANKEIGELKNQPLERRSIRTKRFLKKGNNEETESMLNSLDKVADKRFICDTLQKACTDEEAGKITDPGLAQAVVQFEQSNIVSPNLVKGLEKAGYSLPL